MDKLLEFLRRHYPWFVFLALQLLSLSFWTSGTLYTKALSWYATNTVFGHLHETMTHAWAYLDLREANEVLLDENAQLRHSYALLKRELEDLQADSIVPRLTLGDSVTPAAGQVVTARIINRVTQEGEIFYTINKGQADGIQADMGVMSASGVVGAVFAASAHYALVIPVLNPKIQLSCTIVREQIGGTLLAPADIHATQASLSNVPPHAKLRKGDSVVTSGYSYLFPEGMLVGRISDSIPTKVKGNAGTFANYPLQLATNFQTLRYVYVLLTKPTPEVKALEDSIRPQDE